MTLVTGMVIRWNVKVTAVENSHCALHSGEAGQNKNPNLIGSRRGKPPPQTGGGPTSVIGSRGHLRRVISSMRSRKVPICSYRDGYGGKIGLMMTRDGRWPHYESRTSRRVSCEKATQGHMDTGINRKDGQSSQRKDGRATHLTYKPTTDYAAVVQ